MYGSILSYGNDGDSPGVQRVLTEQSTTQAAKQAITEQKHGDEFNQPENPDIQSLVDRLNEVEAEKSRLSVKLYGQPNYYQSHSEPYKGPPYLMREQLNRQMNRLDQESWAIRAQLREIVDGMSANLGLDESNKPYTGDAKVISPDKGI